MAREPLWRRYDRFFGPNRRKDADDELAFHLDMRVRDYMSRGMDEDAARRAAAERIGDLGRVRSECAAMADDHTSRTRRREWLDELRQDLRYGLRMLARSPAFTLVAVLTLGLGIGATTAIFSVVDRVLLAPLPFADADRLVRIYESAPDGRNPRNPVSPGNVTDWAARARSFSAVGAFNSVGGLALTGDGDPAQVMGVGATPSAMGALGVRPQIGHVFSQAEADGGAVLLSDGFWRRRFGGDSGVIGTSLVLNGVAHSIVGVLPPGVEFPQGSVDLWRAIPTSRIDPAERRSHNFGVVARLAPGVSREQADAEMRGIAGALATEYPQFMTGWGVSVEDWRANQVREARPLLLILIGAVAVVLLIACANLANLLLARAVIREREFVLRGALGAGRARLVRQLLTESLLIAVFGGVLGVVAAGLSLETLLALAPPIPFAAEASVSWPVAGFAAGLTLASTLIFGLAPALRLARTDLHDTLRAVGSAGAGRHVRLRGALLTAQIALSVMLLTGAGLLVRSFDRLVSTDLGFPTEGLSVMALDLPAARYPGVAQHVQFYSSLLERLGHVPGVRGVAGTSVAPAAAGLSTWSFAIEGRPATNPSGREDPEPIHFVAGDYFNVLGLPLRGGRALDEHDREGAPAVVVINDALARLHWDGQDPVGKRISLAGAAGPWIEIVGVVGDARMASVDSAAVPAMYMPYAQTTYAWLSWMSVLIRLDPATDAAAVLPALRSALWELDAEVPVQSYSTVEALYRDTMARRSFAMTLIVAFGCLALVLSVVGIYGLASYMVAQQRREIGVRIALGASPGGILREFVGGSLRLAAIGVVVGLIGAAASTRALSSLLYGVSPMDPATFGVTVAIVLTVAAAASCIPASRAARTSPLSALR